VEVNGPDTHPVFKFLKDHTPLGHGGGADIEWNFAKWVVNKKGYPVVSAPAPKQEVLVCAEVSPLPSCTVTSARHAALSQDFSCVLMLKQ